MEWVCVEERDALSLHERLLVLHGGAPGVRDLGLLQSALARPQHLAAYDEGANLAVLAAAYTVGIVQNHPFIDGNKRTGFVVGILFVELNGGRFTALELEAAEAVVALAAGRSDQMSYAAFVAANLIPQKP